MNVMNCPATSSITTHCGSFFPEARATRVAAGMPAAIAAAASRTGAIGCQPTGIPRLTAHHSRTVAADAQLPGPGRSRPVPKNVAMSVAQAGAGDVPCSTACRVRSPVSCIVLRPADAPRQPARRRLYFGLDIFLLFFCFAIASRPQRVLAGVFHRRRDHVLATGPFSQIEQAAALAAEREFWLRILHRFLTDGTTHISRTLPGHIAVPF